MELIMILGVALLVFGPKKLPDLGKSLGSGLRSFKESVSGDTPATPSKPQVEGPKEL